MLVLISLSLIKSEGPHLCIFVGHFGFFWIALPLLALHPFHAIGLFFFSFLISKSSLHVKEIIVLFVMCVALSETIFFCSFLMRIEIQSRQ